MKKEYLAEYSPTPHLDLTPPSTPDNTPGAADQCTFFFLGYKIDFVKNSFVQYFVHRWQDGIRLGSKIFSPPSTSPIGELLQCDYCNQMPHWLAIQLSNKQIDFHCWKPGDYRERWWTPPTRHPSHPQWLQWPIIRLIMLALVITLDFVIVIITMIPVEACSYSGFFSPAASACLPACGLNQFIDSLPI